MIKEVFFDEQVAKEVGTNSAIILEFIECGVLKNEDDQVHFYDGVYWTKESVSSIQEACNWLSYGQIRRALAKLKSSGYLLVGNYNNPSLDRTKWYSSVRINSKK